jgi:hypothetical protein
VRDFLSGSTLTQNKRRLNRIPDGEKRERVFKSGIRRKRGESYIISKERERESLFHTLTDYFAQTASKTCAASRQVNYILKETCFSGSLFLFYRSCRSVHASFLFLFFYVCQKKKEREENFSRGENCSAVKHPPSSSCWLAPSS